MWLASHSGYSQGYVFRNGAWWSAWRKFTIIALLNSYTNPNRYKRLLSEFLQHFHLFILGFQVMSQALLKSLSAMLVSLGCQSYANNSPFLRWSFSIITLFFSSTTWISRREKRMIKVPAIHIKASQCEKLSESNNKGNIFANKHLGHRGWPRKHTSRTVQSRILASCGSLGLVELPRCWEQGSGGV